MRESGVAVGVGAEVQEWLVMCVACGVARFLVVLCLLSG